jgi:hypothetical protein
MSKVTSFRLTEQAENLIKSVADLTGLSRSAVIELAVKEHYKSDRHAILNNLASEIQRTKKALVKAGVPESEAKALIIERI